MAKLKAPLLSFDARGKLADTLVFAAWKGIAVARQYVVPANPNSAAQQTQRGYLDDIVTAIHAAEVLAADALGQDDKNAYNLLGTCTGKPMTWFNAICRQYMTQRVAALFGAIIRGGTTTPGANELVVHLNFTEVGGSANHLTAGTFYYGVSKSNLSFSEAAVIAGDDIDATLAGLTSGVKYFWKFVASAHADYVGVESGIYSGTPT